MRILWITPNEGNYRQDVLKGSGGWIGALQSEIQKKNGVKLALTFVGHKRDKEKIGKDGTHYFPVRNKLRSGRLALLLHEFFTNSQKEERCIVEEMKRAIDSFNPDIIQVWGIENVYASIIPLVIDKPLVVHIQGFTSIIKYIYMPNGFSEYDLKHCEPLIYKILGVDSYSGYKKYLCRAEREIRVSKFVKNWIGRTDWDKNMSEVLSPESKYYHCEEMMRSDFNNSVWSYHYKEILHIHSTIKHNWYKGIDIILETAKLLNMLGYKIQWNVYGTDMSSPRVRYFVKKLHIRPEKFGIVFHGCVDGRTINKALLYTDVFVHPSYIENSSNAIAEAMLLGVPTIAQYVGGNPTMLRDDSGILVAPNEPYILAKAIIDMTDEHTATKYSEKALKVAKERQNSDNIVNRLLDIYIKIINEENKNLG